LIAKKNYKNSYVESFRLLVYATDPALVIVVNEAIDFIFLRITDKRVDQLSPIVTTREMNHDRYGVEVARTPLLRQRDNRPYSAPT
jgi:hypothetical protein